MKRIIWILLALMLALCVGCAVGSPQEQQEGFGFYYPTAQVIYGSSEGVIAPEQRSQPGDLTELLTQYLAGPLSQELTSPFPQGTALVNLQLREGVLTLYLSQELAALTGLKRTIACSCISRTCLQWPEVSSVRIYAAGEELSALTSGRGITQEDVLLTDDSTQRESTTYTLYYPAENGRYLIGEEAVFQGTDAEICQAMFQRLLHPPQGRSLSAPIPDGTKLLGVRIDDGVCTLKLSAEFENGSSWDPQAQRMTLLSIVNTMTQLEGVDSLSFQEEETPLYTYRFQDLRNPWVADPAAIGPVRTSLGELDADVYVPVGSQGLMAPIPVRVSPGLESGVPRRVLEALLAYRGCNGYESPLPTGVRLLALDVKDRVAQVTLSAEFLTATNPQAAARSVVATLCALAEIDAVTILAEGQAEPVVQNLATGEDWCY